MLQQVIIDKDAEIKKLKDSLAKANFIITFLQQENQQLEVNQLISSRPKTDIGKEDAKGKAKFEMDISEDHEEPTTRKRPRTRSLVKTLQRRKEKSPPQKPMSLHDQIAADFENNLKYWLGRIHEHMENLLKKANKDNQLRRHMASHYYTRNQIYMFRIKNLKRKLRKTLAKQRKDGKLDFLADSSLMVYNFTSRPHGEPLSQI